MRFRRTKPADEQDTILIQRAAVGDRAFAPHCDQRILHALGECQYCDQYPDWQELRKLWGIAFTGHRPDIRAGEVECPADYNRPPGSTSDHRHWPGNQASQ